MLERGWFENDSDDVSNDALVFDFIAYSKWHMLHQVRAIDPYQQNKGNLYDCPEDNALDHMMLSRRMIASQEPTD